MHLGPAEAAIFETYVVPKYLHLFGELLLEHVVEGEEAQVLHLNCRTGYPDRGVAMRLPGAYIYGVDSSVAAVELARAKAGAMAGFVGDYRVADPLKVPFPDAAFSHVYTLHPFGAPDERSALLAEMARVTAPGGQALISLPLRGSFQELVDLLREYALKHDAPHVATGVESAVMLRPTLDTLEAEMTQAGFRYVELDTHDTVLTFRSAREFLEDPTMRLLLFPEFQYQLGLADVTAPFDYVHDAIDRYWSETPFELTVEVGLVAGRKA